jgi:hypothetical protein
MQLAGSPAGIAYAGGIADNAANGYALGLRPFQIVEGWLSGPIQVSREFGKRSGTSLSGCLSPALVRLAVGGAPGLASGDA